MFPVRKWNVRRMQVLKCKNCGSNAVPVKVVKKLNFYALTLSCPECHEKTERKMGIELDDWFEELRAEFFSCENCGHDNEVNWYNKYQEDSYLALQPIIYNRPTSNSRMRYQRHYWGNFYNMRVHPAMSPSPHHCIERMKFVFTCESCGKRQVKISDRRLCSRILMSDEARE